MSKKTGHKRTSNEASTSSAGSDHVGMDCSLQPNYEEDFPPLPITPTKPPLPKKPSIIQPRKEHVPGSDDAFRSLADLINSRSDALERMMESVRGEIKALDKKVTHIEGKLEGTEISALKTSSRVSELERYSRRWNLRLHGLKETREENVRAK